MPEVIDDGGKHDLFLPFALAKRFVRFFHVTSGESAGINQMCHQWCYLSPEKPQDLVDQTTLRGRPGNDSLENVRIAYLFCLAYCLFGLESRDHRLHGRVCRAALYWKGLLNLPDGAGAMLP
ncbi:MAG TPA: hypothetical protein VGM97_16365 [Steroidobacteraceae bacterium]